VRVPIIVLVATTALACTLIGFRVGQRTEIHDGEMSKVDLQSGNTEVDRSQSGAPADRGLGQERQPTSTQQTPLVLPRMGSLDRRLINGEERLRGVLIKSVTSVRRLIVENCRHLHRAGDTDIEMDLHVAIRRGVFSILGASNIGVRRGAPLAEPAARCISQLFATPIEIGSPSPLSRVLPGLTGIPTRRWYGLEGTEGTVVATTRFTDRPDCN
jgi:hypothetical protein